MKQPSSKKRRPLLLRVPVLLALAAGAGVAVLASREDGREKLGQFGELLGKSLGVAGTVLGNARELAGGYIEQFQGGKETPYTSFGSYQPNGNGQRQGELTHIH
jgi:hypothetical protein